MKRTIFVFCMTLLLLTFSRGQAQTTSAQTLFAVTRDAKLLRVDMNTGAVTEVGDLGITFPSEYVGMDSDVDGTMYIGESRQGLLFKVDLNTGAATFVRSISTSGGLILENMAFAPVSVPGPGGITFPAGTLFGSETGQLHAIDINTGGTQFIGLTGRDDDAYAMSPDGTLYAVDGLIEFYRVDTRSAARTNIRFSPPCWVSLTFGPDGFLYCVDRDPPFPLYRMDPVTGNTTLVGNTGHFIIGLAFEQVTQISIDIKPGSDPNSINCANEDEGIAVAILTTGDFDATTVDHTTVTFEGASETHVNKKTGESRRHEEDVDGDGDIDLVFHFRLGDTDLTCDATEGVLTGTTFDGRSIVGTDSVRMIDQGDGKP